MVPIDIEALISKWKLIESFYLNYLARACNGYMEKSDLSLNLDIADIVKQKPSQYIKLRCYMN